ncbi:MAG TPA: asparaginase [Rugosimonospora sp.]
MSINDRYAELARVTRNGFVESRHYGSVVVLDPAGDVVLRAGVPDEPVLPRSTLKPLQALATLAAGAPLSGPALAIAAGSHTGDDRHAAVVTAILAAAGLPVGALRCPVDWPEDEATRLRMIRAGEGPQRIRMNCSGKHAAMLAAAAAHSWPTDERYLDPAHPVQREARETVERLTGTPVTHVAVDGCGAPLFGLPLRALAAGFQALALAPAGSPEAAVADAMRTYPEYVGGWNRHPNTALMRAVPGMVAKGGAEGVLGAATRDGYAVAVKVIDGSPRATTLIALAALAAAGVPTPGAEALRSVPVLGGGEPVGAIEGFIDGFIDGFAGATDPVGPGATTNGKRD